MPIKLFGKEHELSLLKAMFINGRMPHGIIFTGENGIGKRTLALYCASLMMCSFAENGEPCGKCLSCRKIEDGQHPDLIYARGDKYTKDSIRAIVRDSFYKPNDGSIKVYIFTDCEELTDEYQNLLLKIIEEPNESCRYIFTCESPSVILDTVMSRLIHISLEGMTEEECASCLKYLGMEQDKAVRLSAVYGANPGKALKAAEDEQLIRLSEAAEDLAKRIAENDEYGALLIISSFTERKEIFALVSQLYDIVCRAMVGSGYLSDGAKALSGALTVKALYSLGEALLANIGKRKLNVSVKLMQCELCSELFSSILNC